MDRNERNRRHKQNLDAMNQRRNAQQRSGSRQNSSYQNSRANTAPRRSPQQSRAARPAQTAQRTDHAPVYDQDYGRTPAPQPQKRRGKKQHVHVTKKELRRRARRRRMLAVFLVLAAVVTGAVLSVTLLFKVTSIAVQNPEGYLLAQQTQAAPSPAASASVPSPEPSASAPSAVPESEPIADSAASSQAAAPDSEPIADSAASSPIAAAPESTATPQPTAAPTPEVLVDTGPYTELQITSALGVQLGDNLFSFKAKEKEAQMALALPLLEEINLRRSYPNALIIQVTPAEATYCTPVDSGWLVLSRSLKVMELVAEQPQTLKLLLCDAKSTQPGTQLATLSYDRQLAEYQAAVAAAQLAAADPNAPQATMPPDDPIEDQNRVALDELMTALKQAGLLEEVTAIDTANPEETAFLYQDRICVLLGTTNQMEYKMDWATTILRNVDGKGCSATDAGVLDISNIRTDGTIQPVFRQGGFALPSQQTTAPEPAGEDQTDPGADSVPPPEAELTGGETP